MINKINIILNFFEDLLIILRNRKGLSLSRQTKLLLFYLKINLNWFFESEVISFEFDGIKFNFVNLHSFINLFAERFIRHEYSFETNNKKPTIIDAGANIGDSTLYFKYFYPQAKIIAFEPDEETFALLKLNTEKLKDVKIFNQALSDKKATLNFYSEGVGGGNNSLISDRVNGTVKRVKTVRLSEFIKTEVDLLKLDIEGAELSVMIELDKSKKLKLVKELYIEYHHHIPNTTDSFSKILAILEKNGFKYQLSTGLKTPLIKGIFQDILIYAYASR